MTNAQVLRAAKIINRHPHVIPYYFLIIRNPCEKEQDLIETIRFNNRKRSLSLPFIAMKMQLMRLRSRIAEQVKKFHGDPTAVYDLRSRRR